MAMLEVNNIHTYYGNIEALRGVSLEVNAGEVVTLIGANGAGKSTTLRTISGLLQPRVGQIKLNGEDLAAYPAHERVFKGIAMVPEGRGVFSRLSVEENLEMGAYSRARPDRSRPGARLCAFPAPEGAPRPGGRYALWWRAANAGYWPRLDGAPQTAAHG